MWMATLKRRARRVLPGQQRKLILLGRAQRAIVSAWRAGHLRSAPLNYPPAKALRNANPKLGRRVNPPSEHELYCMDPRRSPVSAVAEPAQVKDGR